MANSAPIADRPLTIRLITFTSQPMVGKPALGDAERLQELLGRDLATCGRLSLKNLSRTAGTSPTSSSAANPRSSIEALACRAMAVRARPAVRDRPSPRSSPDQFSASEIRPIAKSQLPGDLPGLLTRRAGPRRPRGRATRTGGVSRWRGGIEAGEERGGGLAAHQPVTDLGQPFGIGDRRQQVGQAGSGFGIEARRVACSQSPARRTPHNKGPTTPSRFAELR